MRTSVAELPLCPYCKGQSELVDGSVIYPHRGDEFSGQKFYRCAPCQAWVGVHRGTFTPLGRLANAELRRAKSAAHDAFDPLWQAKIRRDGCSKKEARGAGYAWLAGQLGIAPEDAHIGMMDVDLCLRVVEVCKALRRTGT